MKNSTNNKFKYFVISTFLAGILLAGCGGGGGSKNDAATVSPLDNEINISRGTAITATFHEDILSSSLNTSTFMLNDSVGNVHGGVTFTDGSNLAVFTPTSTLAIHREYFAHLTNGITELGGDPITPMTWSFTTEDATWGTEYKIESDDVNDASYPQISYDASGNAVAVWIQQNQVWANYYDHSTESWGGAETISTDMGISHLQVAMTKDGDAVAVWSQNIAGEQSIYSNRYSAGIGWGTDEAIENLINDAWNTRIAIDAAGNIMVVWAHDDGAGNYDIRANYLAAGDSWNAANSTLIEAGAGHAKMPQLFANDGTFIVTWIQQDNGFDHVWVNRYAANVWEGEQQIDSEAADAVTPQVVVDTDGNAIAIWEQSFDSYDSIWVSHYTADDTWAAATVIEMQDFNASSPQITMDYAGNAMAVWIRNASLYSANYSKGGSWGTPTLVEENSGNASFPQLAMDTSGNALVVWRQASNSVYSTWVNRYQHGNGWGMEELLENDDLQQTMYSEVEVDGHGRGFALWVQNDGSADSVWVNRFD